MVQDRGRRAVTSWAATVRLPRSAPAARGGQEDTSKQAAWCSAFPPSPAGALTQPDVSLEGHQHVTGLQVPVDDPLAVQEVKCFQHLPANDLNLGLGEASVQLWKARELVNSASARCRQLQVKPTHKSTNMSEHLLCTTFTLW